MQDPRYESPRTEILGISVNRDKDAAYSWTFAINIPFESSVVPFPMQYLCQNGTGGRLGVALSIPATKTCKQEVS
jgi:hypothetical protein